MAQIFKEEYCTHKALEKKARKSKRAVGQYQGAVGTVKLKKIRTPKNLL